METQRLYLIPFTAQHAGALAAGVSQLGSLLRARVPEGWPHFPEAYSQDATPSEAGDPHWGGYLFMLKDGAALVGSGGYKGEPRDGVVEVGYEIAPEFQGQGFASEATRGMIERAFSFDEVQVVQGHTLAERNPSTRVLEKVGMKLGETLDDPEVGAIWRWTLARATPPPDGPGPAAAAG